MKYSFFRFHIPDPVDFKTDIRVTIQQIGFVDADDPIYQKETEVYEARPGLVKKEKGSAGLFERQDSWSCIAYFYLDKAEDDLPPLEGARQRIRNVSRRAQENSTFTYVESSVRTIGR